MPRIQKISPKETPHKNGTSKNLSNNNSLDNVTKFSKPSSVQKQQKKQFKDIVLEKLYSSEFPWERDISLSIPKALPKENLPFLQPRFNTHHVKNILLIEEKEQPLENGNCLWLGAKINKTHFKDKITDCYESLLSIMSDKMVQKLHLLKPSVVNANILMKDPKDSQVINIIFVVAFDSSSPLNQSNSSDSKNEVE